jgi:hypothetical protein
MFTHVLQLYQQAGLVSLGHVAVEGTKIRANASTHTAMRYGRMQTAEPELAAEVARWLAEAAASEAREDAAHGVDRRGDELPDWVTHKQHRVEKIRAAKAALEAEAQADAEAQQRKDDPPSDRPRRGRPSTHPPGTPPDRAPRNFTDPDSRIMKAREGFIQGYTAQAAVDAGHQVIVAQGLTSHASDAHQLEPMLDQIRTNTGRQARELSADAGYCYEHNLKALNRRRIRGYVATRRHKHGEASATGAHKDGGGDANSRDADPPETRRVSQSLSSAKTGGRTRVRPDQTGAGLQAVLAAGSVAGLRGVECGLQCQQCAETGRCERMKPPQPITTPPIGARIGPYTTAVDRMAAGPAVNVRRVTRCQLLLGQAPRPKVDVSITPYCST